MHFTDLKGGIYDLKTCSNKFYNNLIRVVSWKEQWLKSKLLLIKFS
jgi:hypothetical protein